MGLKSAAEERLQQAFADVGTERGGDFYVPAAAASRYIDACVRESLAIAGVEVFRLEEGKLKPNLNQIADFSSIFSDKEAWEILVRATVAEAHRFLAQVPLEADARLSFTLVSEEEYRSR
jgi:hypothetical protein